MLLTQSLQFWMSESNISIVEIGLSNVSIFPYVFQFLWTQVIDSYHIPILSRLLGHRRSWFLFNQCCIAAGIFCISCCNPTDGVLIIVCIAFVTALFASTQEAMLFSHDIARNVGLKKSRSVNSIRVSGVRIGMLFASAGSLYIASKVSWNQTYKIMAITQFIGVMFFMMLQEPAIHRSCTQKKRRYNLIAPIKDIMNKKLWLYYFVLLLIYRAGDNLMGGSPNIFYASIGFTKIEIASISKTFGTFASVTGALIAGYWVSRLGTFKTLFVGLLLHILGILSHIVLNFSGKSYYMLYFVVALSHVTSGMRTSTIIDAKQGLCSQKYAATQFSIIGSISMLPRAMLSSVSGFFINNLGWNGLFVSAALAALPAVVLVMFIIQKRDREDESCEIIS